jgi:hypothetical protein
MAQPSALFLYNGVFVLDLRLPIATARIRLSPLRRPAAVQAPASFLLHRWAVPLDERD